jgi:hypothetical protein
MQMALVAAGQRSAAGANNNRICVEYFRDFLGGQVDVETIDAPRLHNFYLWCMQKVEERQKDPRGKAGWSESYARRVFDIARTFLRWLAELGVMDPPRNINSLHRPGLRRPAGGHEGVHGVNLLLDTHTLLWLMEGPTHLSGTATALLVAPANRLHLSMASVWEIGIKVGLKKMGLSVPFSTLLPEYGGDRVRVDRAANHGRRLHRLRSVAVPRSPSP